MYSGAAVCFSAVANAAMVWLWGPPWNPGNTEKFIFAVVKKIFLIKYTMINSCMYGCMYDVCVYECMYVCKNVFINVRIC